METHMTEQLPTHLIRPMPAYLKPEMVFHLATLSTEQLNSFIRECQRRYAHANRDDRHFLDQDIEAASWVLSERRPPEKRLANARIDLEIRQREVERLQKQLAEAQAHADIAQAAVDELAGLLQADVLADAEVAVTGAEVAA
jgi:hypothetical protein